MFSPGWVWCQIQFIKDESLSENEEDDIERDDNGDEYDDNSDDENGPEPISIHLRRAHVR